MILSNMERIQWQILNKNTESTLNMMILEELQTLIGIPMEIMIVV